jgi:tetratricopeptide (TPR) repeat protein
VNWADEYFNEGVNFARAGRYAEAINSFDKALAINPNENYTWSKRGDALNNLGRHAEAIASYDTALAINPDYTQARKNREIAYKELMQAQQTSTTPTQIQQPSVDYFSEGMDLAKLGRYIEAISFFDKALTINPNDSIKWNIRGLTFGCLGQYSEALASYDKALALKPDYSDAWTNRGDSLYKLDRHSDALAAYNNAISINSNDTEALNGRGRVQRQLNRYNEALDSYDKSVTLNPNDPLTWNNRGNVLSNLKRYDEAVASYDKAIAINPEDTNARQNREIALHQQEQKHSFGTLRKVSGSHPDPKTNLLQNSPIPWENGYKILNRWEILDIKKGGMGVVYIAYDHEWEKIFAIKTFQDKFLWDDEIIQRFMAEAEMWTKLEIHSNIVSAEFVKKIEGKPLLFLEYIDSGNLDQFIGKFSFEESLDFAIQFCTGMEYAFQKMGVIHRDIKPGNVMLEKNPRFRFGYAFKITDFGLVKALDNKFLVESAKFIGTPLFMPPEQHPMWIQEKFFFKGQITTRSDIYSFGVTLYLLLTGKMPFDDISDIFTKYPERPKHLNPKIPESLDVLIMKCLEKNPDNRYTGFTDLKKNLGKIYNDHTGESYEISGKKESLNAAYWNSKGVSFEELKKPHDAIRCYDKALEMDSGCAEAWTNRGNALETLGNIEEALVCYRKALVINPRSDEILTNIGFVLDGLGKYQEAIECIEKALEINPRNELVWNNKGNVLKNLGKYQDAIGCYNQALEINPRYENAWLGIGIALYNLGKLQEAIVCYDKALNINPRYFEAWNNKGGIFSVLGKLQDAIECYQKAIEINPDFEGAWYNLGFALNYLGKPQEAIVCFEKFIEIAPPQYASQVEHAKQIINELRH